MEKIHGLTINEIAELTGGRLIGGDASVVINDYVTDSRAAGGAALFVPVIGENVDAHDYIADAYRHGCRVTFSSRDRIEPNTEDMAYIFVEQNVYALQRLARLYRERFNIPLLGITGSVAKTTTKEMTAAALSGSFHILKTKGNKNSQVGLPAMMLELEQEHELAVIEMGMSVPGEMGRIAAVARPNRAVFTNIGLSHIGQLGSQENILCEKLHIIDYLEPGGVLILNGDDPLLSKLAAEKSLPGLSSMTQEKLENADIVTYGTGAGCDFRAGEITYSEGGTDFTFYYNENEDEGRCSAKQEAIRLNTAGRHNVMNALAALTAAYSYGVSPKEAKKGLAAYNPPAMRGSLEEVSGITLLDDSYNSSPDSVRGALDIFDTVKAVRKAAVLAGILELGSRSKELHYEVGRMVGRSDISLLVTVGEEAKEIESGALEIKPTMQTRHFDSNSEVSAFIDAELKPGDAVLIKGSRGKKLEEVAGSLRACRSGR